MVERDAGELEEINERQESIFSDDLSVGATWAYWETAKQHGIYTDLCNTFGKADGSNLLRLGIYQYLVGDALSGFEVRVLSHNFKITSPVSKWNLRTTPGDSDAREN